MKKNNTNKIVVLSIIGVVLVISLVVFILNYSKNDTSFSILEKKWLNDNSNSMLDISVFNDIPIYGESGSGVIFDFIDQFKNNYGVEFNEISYLTNTSTNLEDIAFVVLNNDDELTDKDILIYEDDYVLVTNSNQNINEISDISNMVIGTMSADITNVSYYLYDASDTAFKSYDNIQNMDLDLKNGDINGMIVPMNMYLDDILENDFYITYHISDLSKKYVLRIKENNTLLNIMKKYYNIFMKDYEEDSYRNNFINSFFNYKGLNEVEKASYNNSSYVYGYVRNMPFEYSNNREFVGIISNYLTGFEDLTNTDIKITEYSSIKDLKKALSSGDVDVIFANYNATGLNVDIINTTSLFAENYVVLSTNNILINSMRSLKGKTVYTVSNTYLYDALLSIGADVKAYNNSDDLLRNIDNSSIVVVDYDTYDYYKTRKFKDYKVIYEGTMNNDYTFVIRDVNKNTTFSELFKYYVSSINYNEVKYDYNTDYILVGENEFSTLFKYLFMVLGTVFIVIIGIIVILKSKKKRKKNSLTKEDKYKFIDIMTSLKNRNYLNYNIKKWEDNVIYPQAIIVIDLNNIKYINDNYGHEEGDCVIKKAASILIVNQKENSDIIRTDGNEFLIYMVGYNEEQIISYTRKLNKELCELQHGFGATLGYSMITDDIKTIDDAINEATLAMREAKERD